MKISFSNKTKILSLDICGVIDYFDGGFFSKSKGMLDIMEGLHKVIMEDSEYKGVILRINSPGGAAGASEEMTAAIKAIRNKGIPVIASVGNIAASGAYMAASACSYIFANKTSLIGSIGVIMQLPDLSGLSEKLGAKYNIIKSGEMKDIGNPTREMTPEEREYLEDVAKKSHEEFINIVKNNRSVLHLSEIADGRILDAHDAHKYNLIDAYGTYYDALRYLCKKLDVEERDIKIEELDKGEGLFSVILNNLQSFLVSSNVPSLKL